MKTVVERLVELIRIPSVSAISNRPVMEYAATALRGVGWTTREMVYLDAAGVEKVNLIAAPAGQDVATRHVELAFVCHTDTVPYAAGWTGATEPVVRDGFVHGCGACDVKGFLACLIAAATSCRKYAAGLRVVLTADEEVGCVGAKRLLESNAIRAKRMVVGEPTSLRVARAGKGYCLARMLFTGKEAHSAHPEKGVSAIFAAARMVIELAALAERLKVDGYEFYEPPCTTLNIGTIQGGTAKNIVPGQCEFLVEWRPIAGPDEVPGELQRLADGVQGCGCKLEVLRMQQGFETPADAGLVRWMEEAAGQGSMAIPFGSEASIFAATTDEIVVFGAGDMRTAHSDRECVPVAELEQAVRVLAGLMTLAAIDTPRSHSRLKAVSS